MGKRNGKGGAATLEADDTTITRAEFHGGTLPVGAGVPQFDDDDERIRSRHTLTPEEQDEHDAEIASMIGDTEVPEVRRIPLVDLAESPKNTRQHFDQVKLEELADSLRTTGQTTPILVRPLGPNHSGPFEIAAGHRRFRAARHAGLPSLLAIVRELDDTAFMEILTIENLQREDVHPLEEADGYAALMLQDRSYDVPKLARRVGKSETYVYDRLKLRSLIPSVREVFFAGRITPAHAIELSRLNSADQERAMEPDGQGGLWQHETAEDDQDSLDLKDAGAVDPYEDCKPVSVRELKSWIRHHVRFDAAADHVPVLFPETAAELAEAAETKVKVVHITRDYRVADDARDANGVRTLGVSGWKRADGKSEHNLYTGKDSPSATCEHSVLGLVVVGPGQGEAFAVCTRKDKCRTHWGAEIREKEKAAKERESESSGASSGKKSAAPKESWWERDERLRNEKRAKMEPVLPAIRAALLAAVQKASTKPTGVLGTLVLQDVRIEPEAKREMPVGKTADDFIRHLAWAHVSRSVLSEYQWDRALPKVGKALGVDVKALIKAAQPKTEKVTKATKAPAKKAAKKKARR